MKSSLYIDDLASVSRTVEEAYSKFIKAKRRLKEAEFHMQKWKTNSKELSEVLNREEITFEMPKNSVGEKIYVTESLGREESEGKSLGVKWDKDKGELKCEFTCVDQLSYFTSNGASTRELH